MSIRAVLSCNGTEGIHPCRQAVPVGEVESGQEARCLAAREGWTTAVRWPNGLLVVDDLCPACTRRRRQ